MVIILIVKINLFCVNRHRFGRWFFGVFFFYFFKIIPIIPHFL